MHGYRHGYRYELVLNLNLVPFDTSVRRPGDFCSTI
eukprot:SAG31_NODE_3352_length_4370_cov_3.025749_6_plen_36_part_00